MKKVVFICLGNICRSPMAEFVFKDMLKKAGLENDFLVESRATSYEAVGCDIHHGTKSVLKKHKIPFNKRQATKFQKEDYDKYDLIITMENANILALKRYIDDKEHKIHNLLEFAGSSRDIADPWYTGNFDITYNDIKEGLEGLLNYLCKNK